MNEKQREKENWALIPNLTWNSETEKAILFAINDPLVESPGELDCVWLPKSQLHPFILANSSSFVGIPLWLGREKKLEIFAIIRGDSITLEGLRYWEKKLLARMEFSQTSTSLEFLDSLAGGQRKQREKEDSTRSLIESRILSKEPIKLPRSECYNPFFFDSPKNKEEKPKLKLKPRAIHIDKEEE